jgi:hypothetical protein
MSERAYKDVVGTERLRLRPVHRLPHVGNILLNFQNTATTSRARPPITKEQTESSVGLRLPAAEIEQLVTSRVRQWLLDPGSISCAISANESVPGPRLRPGRSRTPQARRLQLPVRA